MNIPSPPPQQPDLQRLQQKYFSDPARQLELNADAVLVEQGQRNERLFLILEGTLSGYFHQVDEPEPFRVFHSGPGMFIGVQSFFSGTYISYCQVVADSDCRLAWIDTRTPAVDPQSNGSLREQFLPVIISRLYQRTLMANREAIDKERALRQLHRSETLSTLGQLAAGLAHELNNSMGVLERKSEFLATFLVTELRPRFSKEFSFFKHGLEQGQHPTSAETRNRTRTFEQQLGLPRHSARMLARIAPTVDDGLALGQRMLTDLDRFARFWDAGRDLYDMRLAAQHAANILKSIKLLAGTHYQRTADQQLNESIEQALTLLNLELRGVELELQLGELPTLEANQTELIQIWVNLLKNALEACAGVTERPAVIQIRSESLDRHIRVLVCDNGPGIPSALQTKIFQPNFSTKKNGLSFGLGLGLSIVQRLVESYHGTLTVSSQPGQTCFCVQLPTGSHYGTTDDHLRG